MSDKIRVLFSGPIGTRSGYGSRARDLVHALIDIDKYDVKIMPQKWGNTPENALSVESERDRKIIDRIMTQEDGKIPFDVSFQVTVPNEFQKWAKFNIGVTAGFEATVVPPKWVQGANNAEMVLFSTNHSRDSIANSTYDINDKQDSSKKVGELKLTTKNEVLFEGADTSIFKPTKVISKELKKEMNKISETFCFLFVGHWLQGGLGNDRKDTGMLVKTFFESFKNKKKTPALILKTSGADFSVIGRNEILKKIEDIRKTVKAKSLPNVYVLHGDLEDEEMNELYNHPKVKAHVSFTHGEGFGRPLLEASLSGKPVIVSGWSGHMDFINHKNAVLLPGSLVGTPKDAFPKDFTCEGQKWFSVNYSQASAILKDVFKNYKKYEKKAKLCAHVNKSKFSMKAMRDKLETILDENLPNFPKQVAIKLPKLKKTAGAKGDKGETNQPTPKVKLPKLKKVN